MSNIKKSILKGTIYGAISATTYLLTKQLLEEHFNSNQSDQSTSQEKHVTNMILGVTKYGNKMETTLERLPHLLVAGVTGSGKSVGVNSMLVSLIKNTTPNELRLALIDPKTVEYSGYKGSPHLLLDPITNMEEANKFVDRLVDEMERRYTIFNELNVKKLDEYHALAKNDTSLETLPYIVLVIDEFSDLIAQYKGVEKQIARLGQKSRAAGIHMIIATQSPRREVITGLIKANIPSRLAYMVANSTESQIALDETGAERLMPYGEFLIRENSYPSKLGQAPFISNEELNNIIEADKKRYGKPNYINLDDERNGIHID
ncbi:FtsK/SpoIIIE domain-containing protein [Staphylococcus hominis]|uniref:FtsK/SpoIIIE domain-containing protein n=1 Tax=Staphylococcus hominis TaxID=1290 RepID=UPI003DA0CB68